ncbi:MAG TPA: hypothetical protein VH120_07710, partial [Gemmataceae bacterium]|nr:hypothetical protein [Gemmataceae bacterium]
GAPEAQKTAQQLAADNRGEPQVEYATPALVGSFAVPCEMPLLGTRVSSGEDGIRTHDTV